MITRRAGHRCEICGAAEDRAVNRCLEAHERWAYDDATGVQTLRRLICLCSPCHLSTHLGYANVTGRSGQAIAHLRQVTGMTQSQAWDHVDDAGELWQQRSRRTWVLDLTMLTDAGVTLARPDDPAERRSTAARTLAQQPDRQAVPRPAPTPSPAPPPAAGREPAPTANPASDGQRRTWLQRFLNRT
jgi:hypothetical protein